MPLNTKILRWSKSYHSWFPLISLKQFSVYDRTEMKAFMSPVLHAWYFCVFMHVYMYSLWHVYACLCHLQAMPICSYFPVLPVFPQLHQIALKKFLPLLYPQKMNSLRPCDRCNRAALPSRTTRRSPRPTKFAPQANAAHPLGRAHSLPPRWLVSIVMLWSLHFTLISFTAG